MELEFVCSKCGGLLNADVQRQSHTVGVNLIFSIEPCENCSSDDGDD